MATKRKKYQDEDKLHDNAEAYYGQGTVAPALVAQFGTHMSPHAQDVVFRNHGSSLEQAKGEGFTPEKSGHAHVYDVLDHLGY